MATEYLAAPGTKESDLETPALVIDMDVAEAHIARLQSWAPGSRLRPER